MKLFQIYFLLLMITSCQQMAASQFTKIKDLQEFKSKSTFIFEDKFAMFTLDLEDLKSFATAIKQNDSVRYKFSKSEVDFIISLGSDSTKLQNQYLGSKDPKKEGVPLIIKDSIFYTIITEEFLQKKLIEGQVKIRHKRTGQTIESIIISRPSVSHFDVFQAYSNDDHRYLLFERRILTNPR